MTFHHIIDHVFVVRSCLIKHRPASIYKLKSSLFYKLFQLIFHILCLHIIPHREKLNFTISEFSIFIILESFNSSRQYKINLSLLTTFIRSCEIFINSFEPPNIIVRVWHYMNIQWLRLVISNTKVFNGFIS